MSGKSAIEWTDATWNPVTGCSKVSPGCAHCYAEAISLRFGHSRKPWTPENAAENVVLHPDRLDAPLKWRSPRMVFVNSMSDLFHELIPLEFIRSVLGRMAHAQQHTFQVLTKRPERAVEVLRALHAELSPNVWLGVSIENARFTWRADVLREIPAAVRFVSAEPLLGSLLRACECDCAIHGISACACPCPRHPKFRPLDLSGIGWVIVGGESGGRQARPMQPDWLREIRDACLTLEQQICCGQLRGVCCGNYLRSGECCGQPEAECCMDPIFTERPAFFFKQWGSYDEHGVYRGSSPKSGGRLLDGREWNEMPGG